MIRLQRFSCDHPLGQPDAIAFLGLDLAACHGDLQRLSLTDQTRQAIDTYLGSSGRQPGQYLFAGRGDGSRALTTRQYARLVRDWVASIGLDPSKFGTHSLRRTKAVLIYRRTGNLRAVQLLLGHSKMESTVRYLGVEVDDVIELAEKIEI